MQKFFGRRGNKRGFTLIELLVVVLILAILMAVALPLYLSAVADSELKTCRANMQTIENAVQATRVRTRTAYASITNANLVTTLGDLQARPICPVSGAAGYSVVVPGTGGGAYEVQCTASGHGKFEPGVDGS